MMPRRGARAACRAALLLAGIAAPARAQEFRPNLAHWCQDPWMLTPEGMVECLEADLRRADAELNQVYREVMASFTAARRERLRTSQRAWLVRYDSVLTSYYSEPWAGHRRSKVLPSQIRAIRDRTAILRRTGGGP